MARYISNLDPSKPVDGPKCDKQLYEATFERCGSHPWFNQVAADDKSQVDRLLVAFKKHFIDSHPTWLLEQQLFSRAMKETETLEDVQIKSNQFI